MKILVELAEGDKGTPIEMANAIVNWYMDQSTDYEEFLCARESLKAVSEHIDVYLRHQLIDIPGAKDSE